MFDKKLLIIGIDPGTTLGYAIIDIGGNLIKTTSSKNIDLNLFISGTVKFGKVLVVGADKGKAPEMVKLYAAKTGARLISPKYDLKVLEKNNLTRNYNLKDEHQNDALASALFAFKQIRPLLKKINVFIKNYNKEEIKDKIIELVISKKVSISEAVYMIEKPEKEEVKVVKKVVEEKQLTKKDFLLLYNKIKRYEKEILLLKKQNVKLKNQLKNIKERDKYLLKKISQLSTDEERDRLIEFKEKRIQSFDREVTLKDEEINYLQNEVNKLTQYLLTINENYLLKKLKNLGYREFERKNSLLNIKKNDILLVEDPNVFSDKTTAYLKNKVEIIIYKKALINKLELPFVLINANKLNIDENNLFALVSKKDLEKGLNKVNLLSKIIMDYKKERIK